jgi:hypothetical protein
MQGALRLLICLVISCSIAFAAVPAHMPVTQIEKASCCATMKMESATHDCDRHAPKPEPDKQCCTTCALCLTAVIASATPFVYPPVGDETFAAYISFEHSRSQRPPVPPPRA